MADDLDKDMERLFEELDDDMGPTQYEEPDTSRVQASKPKSKSKILILLAILIAVLAAFFAFFPSNNGEMSRSELKALQSRLNDVEARLKDLKTVNYRITRLEQRDKEPLQYPGAEGKALNALKEDVKTLSLKLDALQKAQAAVASRPQPKPAAVKPAATPPVAATQAPTETAPRYHIVSRGENLYRISLKYGLSVDELCGLNKIPSNYTITPGQRLIVSR
jgi:LysM repeat protein